MVQGCVEKAGLCQPGIKYALHERGCVAIMPHWRAHGCLSRRWFTGAVDAVGGAGVLTSTGMIRLQANPLSLQIRRLGLVVDRDRLLLQFATVRPSRAKLNGLDGPNEGLSFGKKRRGL